MKQIVSIKSVRNEFKGVTGSMFYCIKCIYGAFTNAEGKVNFPTDLHKIMPTSKKQALSEADKICSWGNVGSLRVIKRKDKNGCETVINSTIKASCDMVLRYYVAKYNGKLAK